MIEFKTGNILDANVDAIVNPVNTVGVMGKGLALQVKNAFPSAFERYRRACLRGDIKIGKMLVYVGAISSDPKQGPYTIINFPTKSHWRDPSKIEYVIEGLNDLVKVVRSMNLKSLAIPKLGCGCGGLDWNIVKQLIITTFDTFEFINKIRIEVYE